MGRRLQRTRILADPGERVDLDELYKRDGATCHLCGLRVARKNATRDHLVPVSAGGETTYANCKLAHRTCNRIRQDRPVEVVRRELWVAKSSPP